MFTGCLLVNSHHVDLSPFQKTAKILVAIIAVFILLNEQRHITKRQTKITGNMVMMIIDSCIIYACNTCAFWIIRKANDATRSNKQQQID
uniref:7TM_GPCR_Srx domain-containing protein n=1 Tax=Panagrellus redivivus TaxID=6233 RepID=A0A7E4WCX0_PANRE